MSLNSTVVDANGRRTEVRETGEGEPLVYLHGGGIVEGFDYLERLADRYHVYLPLMPATGTPRSSRRRGTTRTSPPT